MLIKDSNVTKITPFSLHEESTAVSDCIFPAFTGTSNIVLGIDASGLQNFSNKRLQKSFGSVDVTGDTYIVAHGRMGDHLTEKNALPFGYLTWKIKFDNGVEIDPTTQKDELSCWERDLYIDEGRVSTSMLVNYFAHVTFDVSAPFKTNTILVGVNYKPFDYKLLNFVPEKEPEKATIEIALNMVSRQGKKLYDEAELKNGVLSLKVSGYEYYENKIRLTGNNNAKVKLDGDSLKIVFDISANETSDLKLVCDFDGILGVESYDKLSAENLKGRRQYFDKVAQIDGVNVKETFLYNNCHYLCMSGFDYTKGLPIGMPFMLPKWWRCSTFWDSHFVMDGLMRSNAKKEADEFVEYLHKSMNKTGKPFPWMFAYDAKPTVDDGHDIAPLVMCAHAMTAIKHYFYFKDKNMLEKHILPIVERVADFGAEVLFSKESDGKYILSIPVSNDVVEDEAQDVNQTFTTVWFLSIFKLCLELQKIAKKRQSTLLKDIVGNYKIEKTEEEYLHCRSIKAEDCEWASWIPFLLYPTEAMPFIDKELFDKTREKYSFTDLYMEKQGSYQPWTEFMQAGSDFRRGAIEEGYNLRKIGISHCFGTGLFCEVGPKQQTCGISPYISAHGTYITAYLYQFVSTDIWTDRVGVFDCLPKAYSECDLRVKGVVCSGGITVDAELSEYSLTVYINSIENKSRTVLLRIPRGLSHDKMRVFCNGEKYGYRIIGDCVKIEYTASGCDRFEIK